MGHVRRWLVMAIAVCVLSGCDAAFTLTLLDHGVVEEANPLMRFLNRIFAIAAKEIIQLRRDRLTLGMVVGIPALQLVLFGYAINTTPRNLPTAVLLQEDSDLAHSVLKAFENTRYFSFVIQARSVAEFDDLLKSGKVLFGVEIPKGFERGVRRGPESREPGVGVVFPKGRAVADRDPRGLLAGDLDPEVDVAPRPKAGM